MWEGMLSGWRVCRCGLSLDMQDAGTFQVFQYSFRKTEQVTVPLGCLLVVESREA